MRDAEILGPPVYCVEIALWDIAGKAAGLPVSKMWGRFADRIPVYCATGEVRPSEQRVEDCQRLLDEGFKAVKLRFHSADPRDDLRVVEATGLVMMTCDTSDGCGSTCSTSACSTDSNDPT